MLCVVEDRTSGLWFIGLVGLGALPLLLRPSARVVLSMPVSAVQADQIEMALSGAGLRGWQLPHVSLADHLARVVRLAWAMAPSEAPSRQLHRTAAGWARPSSASTRPSRSEAGARSLLGYRPSSGCGVQVGQRGG